MVLGVTQQDEKVFNFGDQGTRFYMILRGNVGVFIPE